ncbi:NAD(P)-dependent oxidoreductase [Longispora sp. K20-0274]|uniref:NAD-dependent epimerase/dehydratase family protein n=1 Tax=Longispora sp. K20-0274 TaxID=3088255 RepID=UPI00399B2680
MHSRVTGSPLSEPADQLRVVVLGGTGFVGRAVSAAFTDHGHDVLVVSRRPQATSGGVRFVALDLATAEAGEIADLLVAERADVVVNAAGGMWGLTDEQMYDVNVNLVGRLIEAVAAVGHRPRLVHLGTVHEYGLVPVGELMAETMTPAPVMAYGALKLTCTEAITEAVDQGRIDGVTLRIGNVVGAGQPGHSLLGVVVQRLREAHEAQAPLKLELGPLGSQRDFLGLTDAVTAIVAAATVDRLDARVINVGRGTASSARDMVTALIDVSRVPTELVEAAPQQAVETHWQCMDVSLAHRALGWTPKIGPDEELRTLW